MRYLIFSDIHSNLEALEAVLSEVKSQNVQKYLFLGDAVGYYTNPNEVLERLKSLQPLIGIRGNHDKVVAGLDNGENFNFAALKAALWNRERISKFNREFILSFPKGPLLIDDTFMSFMICHGSPYDEDRYIFQAIEAKEILISLDSPLTFFGHTHFAAIYAFDGRRIHEIYPEPAEDIHSLNLASGMKYLINPGSIGQPRDSNPKSSFAIFDSEEMRVSIHRCQYEISSVQKKAIESGLPERLAMRLAVGR